VEPHSPTTTTQEPAQGIGTTQEPAQGIGWHASAFVAVTIVIGVAVCAYSGWQLASRPLSWEWIILLALTVIAGWATLRFPDVPISYSVSDTFSIIAALVVSPAAGAITAAIEGLVLSFRLTTVRRSPGRVLFNMAALAIAMRTAGDVFFTLAGPTPLADGPLGALRFLLLLGTFGVVHFGVNSGIIASVIALERRTKVLPVWRVFFGELWVSSLGGVFAAMLMIVLARDNALETLILIAPLPVIVHVTLRHVRGRAEDQISHLGKMNRVYLATIEALAQAVDAKDHVTHDHVRRVQENSLRLAHALGVRDESEIQALKAASLLHDIGKIAIPEHILNKPGRLTAPEFEVMKRHAAIGADILAVIGFPYPLVPIVRHHHENWDGTGYPDGLAGEQIPIGARILQVVDCFDALTSDRPYRPRLDDVEALKIVTDRSGTMYDPRVVEALVELRAADAAGITVEAARPVSTPAAGPKAVSTPEQILESTDEQLSLETFFDLGRALATPLSASHVGETLWSHLRGQVPGSAFVFFVYDRAADSVTPAYKWGEPTVATGARVPLGDRLSGWVAAAGQPIRNSDARLDLDSDLREGTNLQSALAVPVTRAGETLGVLAFYSRRSDAFDERHQRTAEAAAYVAATALHTVAPRLSAVAV
jgi:putative nucleotidyltransferase with HDIG domain